MKIKEELLRRFELDQKLLKEKKWDKLESVCYENTIWLKNLIDKMGWPPSEIIGEDGELHSWLIVQHSLDINFQERILKLLKQLLPINKRRVNIAYLTDRILVAKNKKQIYGTQFYRNEEAKLIPCPIYNFENLEKRRNEVGLESFSRYKMRLQGQNEN